jgi:methylated-DNA-protein-cysteine methyltransferase-like protein
MIFCYGGACFAVLSECVFSLLCFMKAPQEQTDIQRNFFQDVHEVVRLIPAGRVSTYGAIAHYLGARHGARMVGYALIAAVPARGLEQVPAQRVVNRNGLLTGRHHFATPTAMQEALEAEGVQVLDDQVQDFKNVFWDPAQELV